MGTRVTADLYLRSTNISGDVKELNQASGAAVNATTIIRHAVGNTRTSTRFQPLAARNPGNVDDVVPGVGAARANMGWRELVSHSPDDPWTIDAGTWDIRLDCKRSGQALEVDQSTDTTVIVYEVTSAGAHVKEIGRDTLRFIWTTTLTEKTFSFNPGAVTLGAGNKLQIEIYVVTLFFDIPAAPSVATDLILEINTNASSSRFENIPTHSRQYGRAQPETIPTTATIERSVVTTRPLAESAPATAVLARPIGFFRSLTDTNVTLATLDRFYAAPRALSEVTAVADVLSKMQLLARGLSESYPTIANLERQINMIRTMREYPPGVAPDWPLLFPTKQVKGVTRSANGNPLGNVSVKLFRDADDVLVAEVTSDVAGVYSFVRDELDPNTYWTVAMTDDTTHGVSDRGLTPTPIP